MTNTVLITGITGTLGREVLNVLQNGFAFEGLQIYGIARDEQKLRLVPHHDHLRLALCDIRDKEALEELADTLARVDKIFHFAALKCVDSLENFPMEAFKTNILGTRNILSFAKKVACKKVIFTSTDKAVHPINAYGMTKALAEKLVLRASHANVVCRYGNILGSRGSFLPNLVKSLKDERVAYLTHKDMTRFWMTIDSAARFVVNCGFAKTTGLCVPPNLKSASILTLIDVVAELLDIKDYEVKRVGIRAGEKIHETLYLPGEFESEDDISSSDRFLMIRDELKEMLRPIL